MEDYPNVLIVPDNINEQPIEMIKDYVEIIQYDLDHGVSLEEILNDFFNDVNAWTCKQFLIDIAKQSLQGLEDLQKLEEEFIEDDEENE